MYLYTSLQRLQNYYVGKDKNFDTVMKELRRDAGVRYNPMLVELIDSHTDVAEKLATLVNEGWVDIWGVL